MTQGHTCHKSFVNDANRVKDVKGSLRGFH